jgi:osmoprotectant transport system ATP-binding protein
VTAAVELRGIEYALGGRAIVRGLSLAIEPGETFVLIGPSGCGKSTTLKMINRLIEPDSGSVRVDGRDVRAAEPAELRRGIGYVIQEGGLFAHYTVRQNVALVPHLLGWDERRTRDRVEELLALVGLPDVDFGGRYPRALSGGQRQRVGIARALAADPPLVLLDEPFSALDPITREHLQDEFAALSSRLGKTFVLVTHDVFEAVRLADRIAVLRAGELIQCAEPGELVRRPADPFVASLLGRHRYQLQLMTVTVAEAVAKVSPIAAANADSCSNVESDATVWHALERMGAEQTAFVGIDRAGERACYSREQLVAAAGA